jgi:hypothetical protein
MGKTRRGNYVFLSWSGDHTPRHVHVYKEGKLAVKIKSVTANNKRREFLITNRAGRDYYFPYHNSVSPIRRDDHVRKVYVDAELAREAITYLLDSGEEGSIHIEQVLDFNKDPTYLADLLIYKLTAECIQRVEEAQISRRQLARQLNTSVPQLYRLLDPANTSKSMKQLISLLSILDCEVDMVIKPAHS